ncbi:MAG TPA: PIN domain-containing protein [Dehalococcoidia bacterium]|nr:PIN domain-containing protein [Dehalococcoidia bacterium]
MSVFLVDTNVLVYAHDPRDRRKQDLAREVMARVVSGRTGVLSVQCLTEFYRTVRFRLPEPLDPAAALAQVERFADAFLVLDLTPIVVLEGCRASGTYGLSIWDALIWAAARLNQVPYILTEDTQHERVLEGVRYLNPFVPQFEPGILAARR